MSDDFDFVVVGGGSAGAIIAARLSEDPACRVALLEAGERPPAEELVPAACSALQLNPETDWMYTADPGQCGLGLKDGRMMMPRGKMLGGSSGINYMAYVRGHPADFDAWAQAGATGWSYDEVLPYFKKTEGLAPSDEIPIDTAAHNTEGPLGVSVRSPVIPGAREFVDACDAAGIPRRDYNGRDRGGPAGAASLFQTTTHSGKRSSTFHAFLEGEPERRNNLTVITGAHVTRVLLDRSAAQPVATGVEYRNASGETRTASAAREVVLSGGAIGSPHLLLLSGIGPRAELEAAGVECHVDSPHVGKHLKDHVHVGLFFPAPGVGVAMSEVGMSLGPDALRAPAGPLPADPTDDAHMPEELKALKQEAERRFNQWASQGESLISSSLYDAGAWFSTELGDQNTHDAQIGFLACGYNHDLWRGCFRVDPDQYFDDASQRLADDAESIIVLANPVQPHSEGEIVLQSTRATDHPAIRMNYFDDPHDMKVMIAVMRKVLDVVAHWPGDRRIGPVLIPPFLAHKHGHTEGDVPSDALLEDLARHYAFTVYHPTTTCRIGSVVDPQLRAMGVRNLRVADASVMPNVVSGNTNAATMMIGEKAAEMMAAAHGVKIAEFVGEPAQAPSGEGVAQANA
ncbi:MAG: GMC family oxidoreductase N-terminal domain-containing protein [Salinisphaera sp.]|uniref:GMC family oxidoreductase n=1 Tax=Salinisphaera sp. TaxID=1914330 RepID=UPI003C7B042A